MITHTPTVTKQHDLDPADFRLALRHIPGSVAVITTSVDGETIGMTATAFSSVSVEPPQVLVCINRAARSATLISQAGKFAVNHLAGNQASVAESFATPALSFDERFAGATWTPSSTEVPFLNGAVVSLGCTVDQEIHSGTHAIFIGRVHELRTETGDSLVYKNGTFSTL
ncbi:flavin reductase family protein [Rhodococcus opacus]|uniref:Flavin reductase like domain-containing protein n=1 Tax=Rhodococcus opacus TaxID=37919 RepID=A0A076F707_RHOOP|nr:flavin reductase family protein [Rhodococcus opacus]AII11454.1 hypothetical protein EP51_46580 [Rhodococcus opacus]